MARVEGLFITNNSLGEGAMRKLFFGVLLALWVMVPCAGFGETATTNAQSQDIEQIRSSAEQGNAEAQRNLGLIHGLGQEGVSQNLNEAHRWFRNAAEQGDAQSQGFLGVMYANGLGLTQDYGEALKWLTKAAEQGNASAERNLAMINSNGFGVKRDLGKAGYWYSKAASHGLTYSDCSNIFLCVATPPQEKLKPIWQTSINCRYTFQLVEKYNNYDYTAKYIVTDDAGRNCTAMRSIKAGQVGNDDAKVVFPDDFKSDSNIMCWCYVSKCTVRILVDDKLIRKNSIQCIDSIK
jgi:hypothetical protein